MKKILFLFLFIVLIFNVNAMLPNVKKGDCANLKMPLNALWLNISTITYPNQTMIQLNEGAYLFGGTFYYDFCNTTQEGIYTYEFYDSTGFNSGNSFEVTLNGDSFNTGKSIVYFVLLTINLIFLAIFIYLSITIPYDNESKKVSEGILITKVTKSKYVKLMSIWITYGLFLWFVTIIDGMVNSYLSFQPLKDFVSNLFLFSTIIGYFVSAFMIWFIFANIWKDIILNKTIRREGSALINNI